MESALIISETGKGAAFFVDFLSKDFCTDIKVAKGAQEVKRLLIDRYFDLVIINAPLKNEFGVNLAINIAEKNTSQVILVVKTDVLHAVTEKVEDYGIITIGKPIDRNYLWNAMKLIQASQRRMELMQKEKNKLVKKIEDIKIVNRAKCTLISYLGMSESEAHKYIEKQAMDMRVTKKEVANKILITYEN